MTSNLSYALTANSTAIGSKNDHSTFTFMPSSCASDGDCIMNGNTVVDGTYYYYNWYATTAGEGEEADVDIDVDGSICLAGWRPPENYSVNAKKSFGSLTNSYNLTVDGGNNSRNHASTLDGYPLHFIMAGEFRAERGVYQRGYAGRYWSSTVYEDTLAYQFLYTAGFTYPQNAQSKTAGFSLRCVAL